MQGEALRERQARTQEGLEDLIASEDLLLFKHSPACGTSAEAILQYEDFVRENPSVRSVWIDVIRQRDLARWVAERSGVRHQSPQVLLFRSGAVVWNASHWKVTRQNMEAAVRAAD